MSKIRFKAFENTYGLSMLLHSLASYKIGYRVEWNNRFHKKYEIEQNYFTDDLDLDDPTENQLETLLGELNGEVKASASFGELELDKKNEIQAALNIPSIGINLEGKVNTSKIISFSYEGVKVLSLKDKTRSSIKDKIEAVRNANKKKFKKIKDIGFIEQLFYADNVVLDIDKTYEAELKASLEQLNVKVDIGASGNSSRKFTFKGGTTCPFAAKFESVGDFVN